MCLNHSYYSSGITKCVYCIRFDVFILKGVICSFNCIYIVSISKIADLKEVKSLRVLVGL